MNLSEYEGKIVRVTDNQGFSFTGIAAIFPSGYGLHEFNREEESIKISEYHIFKGEIEKVEILPSCEEALKTITPGRYRHFNGNEYEVIGIARHSETEEPMVVYRALYGEGGLWTRPADMWNETITRDGKTMKRFERVDA